MFPPPPPPPKGLEETQCQVMSTLPECDVLTTVLCTVLTLVIFLQHMVDDLVPVNTPEADQCTC